MLVEHTFNLIKRLKHVVALALNVCYVSKAP